MSTDEASSSGVQELIDRLHQEGLEKGQQDAERILVEARAKALEVLEKAKAEAEETIRSAKEEAERTRIAGEEAMRLAGRDTILQLTEELNQNFMHKLQQLVGQSLRDTEFLKQLILEIGRASVPDASAGPIGLNLLVDSAARDDQSEAEHRAALDNFIRSLGGEALRDGLRVDVMDSDVPGIRVQAVDGDLEIDLTSETMTALLVKHLSPRFRKIIEEA
jgi:V/A-type H+-transporting ATPase subunit E